MLDTLIATTANSVCCVCEQARRLESTVNRVGRRDVLPTGVELARLAESFSAQESVLVADTKAINADLVEMVSIISGALFNGDSKSSRGLGAIASGIRRAAETATAIVDGAAILAGGDLRGAIGKIGGQFGGAIGAAQQAFDTVSRAFEAKSGMSGNGAGQIENAADVLMGDSPDFSGASSAQSHLLILTAPGGESFYFGLPTAAYDTLRRQTEYNIASQDRLTRRPALQAVSKGGESVTVSGAVFVKKSGAGQLDKLRAIGFAMDPVLLTTGYGDVLGQWYLSRVEEEQAAIFPDGMPRMQKFTLEFKRYGEDYSDI